MCGYLRSPAVLSCSEQDWDVIGRGAASRECGAGFTYNVRQGFFLFDIGGFEFTFNISYQFSLVTFSSVHLESGKILFDFTPVFLKRRCAGTWLRQTDSREESVCQSH
ncbi:hypothetical protein WMY93_034199, partial [Mugilogobius chulae]